MSLQPIIINNLLFAKNKSHIDGALKVEDLERLREWIQAATQNIESLGVVNYSLDGRIDGAGQPLMQLTLKVNVFVACQRCFDPLNVKLDLSYSYIVTKLTEAQILSGEVVEESDDFDLLTENREMDVIELIEDEVIAAMPYSSAHQEACVELEKEAGDKPNPFAVLKDLVK